MEKPDIGWIKVRVKMNVLLISEQRCHVVSKVAADTKTQTVTSQSPCICICLYCIV